MRNCKASIHTFYRKIYCIEFKNSKPMNEIMQILRQHFKYSLERGQESINNRRITKLPINVALSQNRIVTLTLTNGGITLSIVNDDVEVTLDELRSIVSSIDVVKNVAWNRIADILIQPV